MSLFPQLLPPPVAAGSGLGRGVGGGNLAAYKLLFRWLRITTEPDICHGQPTVRGLRYPARRVLEILAGYSGLAAEGLRTCQAYAAGSKQVCAHFSGN